ncbi:MAG: ATP synthase F1 subunit delta [Spirochaetia bacterium]|nr:ATP synthase F1 subunit delta [Spirochaetia bacterium]
MKDKELASRYALALSEAVGDKALEIEKSLESIVRIFKDDEKLKVFFESPRISAQVKNKAIGSSLKEKVEPYVLNFLRMLVDRRREFLLEDIFNLYVEENDKKYGRVRAIVTVSKESAANEDQKLLTQIKETIEAKSKKFGISERGDKLEHIIKFKINPEILGGIIVRVGDKLWDASLRKFLNTWKKNIYSGKKVSNTGWES